MATVSSSAAVSGSAVVQSDSIAVAPPVDDKKKQAFDMILSAVMSQKPVLAGAGGDDGDNDDGSELTVGLAGTPSLG